MKLILNSAIYLFLIAIVMALSACKKAAPPIITPSQQDANILLADESMQKQIKISEVTSAEISDILRVAGQIDFDEQALTRIGSSVTGRVTNIFAQLGASVKKGETLAVINSSELSNSQLAYLKARSEKELYGRAVQRAKILFQADVISAAELQRRENEFEVSSAQTRAALDQLRVLGVSPKAIEELGSTGVIDSVASVTATIKGTVVERKVATGQVVQPSDVLFSVADLSRVWAIAQVPEQQITQVKVGQSVQIDVPALGHEKLIGKLIYVGQTVDPESRTVLVRTELDNSAARLKPSMLAAMLIELIPTKRLVVPITAVVREQEIDYVFIEEKPSQFRLKSVKLSSEQNGQRFVLEGLSSGTRIVSDGAFHLNNYRNLKDIDKGK
jgi:membrane fusion protein, heavy metal efflux system